MRRADAAVYRHPATGQPLKLAEERADGDEILAGSLAGDTERFPIIEAVPRFCPPENYASSFGYQWSLFPTSQLDSRAAWKGESARRLFAETGWPRRMEGQKILEAGSGMGRFTEVLAQTEAEVFTFDYSLSIMTNVRNNARFSNVHFAKADVYAPPYAAGSFDKVLCLGVLQHTPSPRDAFLSLTRFLKPGGEIVVDVYRLSWRSVLAAKYYLRPLTRRLPPPTLLRWVRFQVGWVIPLTGSLRRWLGPLARNVSWALGVADYRGVYEMDDATARELAELDTFDMLAPAYDRPQTLRAVRSWFAEAGLVEVAVEPGYNGIQGRGRRPG
jgi:ubiquinone/menaquinone biosynthesis C-methylase UbiE